MTNTIDSYYLLLDEIQLLDNFVMVLNGFLKRENFDVYVTCSNSKMKSKYYFTDIGLRNALINFSQTKPTHIMENIIYNELINRGYCVDVGVVEISEKNDNGNYIIKQLETDFICNKINEKIYIQSAYSMETIEKQIQEKKSLIKIKDNYRKIIIVKDSIKPYFTEEGIEVISLEDWLLN